MPPAAPDTQSASGEAWPQAPVAPDNAWSGSETRSRKSATRWQPPAGSCARSRPATAPAASDCGQATPCRECSTCAMATRPPRSWRWSLPASTGTCRSSRSSPGIWRARRPWNACCRIAAGISCRRRPPAAWSARYPAWRARRRRTAHTAWTRWSGRARRCCARSRRSGSSPPSTCRPWSPGRPAPARKSPRGRSTTSPAAPGRPLRRSIAAQSPTTSCNRSCSGTSAGRSPGRRRAASACSRRRMAAPCSWTRSATCRWTPRPACCGSCRKAPSNAWAATSRSRSTYA